MDGEEERGGDLAVRLPFRHEGGDSALRFRELTAGGRATADARELCTCLLRPQRCADVLEARERVDEGGAGRAATFCPSLGATEGEEGARVLEGVGASRVLTEGVLEAREGAVEIASRGEEERARAREDRERPRAVEPPRALVPRRDRALCLLELASSALLPRAALLCAAINPTRDRDRVGFTFRCARTTGYGVSAPMARRCFEQLDDEGITGTVAVLRSLSGTDNVATQGAVWYVGGKVL